MRIPLISMTVALAALLSSGACGSNENGLDNQVAEADGSAGTSDAGDTAALSSPEAGVSSDTELRASDGVVAAEPDARTPMLIGAACRDHTDCASQLCVGMKCEQRCALESPNDCARSGGFCVPTTVDNVNFCSGDLKLGSDDENDVLQVDDAVSRHLSPLDDIDLFLVRLNHLGTIVIEAKPSAGIDLALDVYNRLGQKIGSFDKHGDGQAEAAQTTAMTVTGYFYVAVSNVGNSTGAYQLKVYAN